MVFFTLLVFFFAHFQYASSDCCTNCDSISTTCLSCSSGFYLYNSLICLQACPEGYSVSGATCVLTSSPIFVNEDFSNYNTWTVNSIGDFQSVSGLAISDSSKDSLIVTKSQGLYSTTNSVLKSTKNWVAAPDLSILAWILAKNDGHIYEAVLVDFTQIRLRLIGLIYEFIFYPLSQSTMGFDFKKKDLFSSTLVWELVTIRITQTSAKTVSLYAAQNNAVVYTFSYSNIEASYTSPLTWTLGCVNQKAFEGFIYKLLMTNEIYSGTLTGPTTEVTCNYNEYFDGSSCGGCLESCTNLWPWCAHSGTCTYCYYATCNECTSFLDNGCICATGCSLCSEFWTCITCHTGYNSINSVCLDYCPTGDCSGLSPTQIIQITFDYFSGNYSGFISGNDYNTYYFFNNPESDDPIPVINRGLYFTPGQFLENSNILLAQTFTVAAWVLTTSGDVFTKGTELLLSYDGQFTILLQDKTDTSSSIQSLTTSLSSWSFVTISVSFSSATTSISCTSNTVVYYSNTLTDSIFRDASQSSFKIGNSFTGFVYTFKVWNYLISDFSSEYNDEPCGAGLIASCLNECNKDEYWNTSCTSCLGECSEGCRNSENCNICENDLCVVCASFVGDCLECITNASGTPCSCDLGYYKTGFYCSACSERCSVCTGNSFYECSDCENNFILWNSTHCLKYCPTGYSNDCLTKNSVYALSLVLNIVEIGKTGTVKFGSSSNSMYPNFDNSDPVPTKSSGYYFLPQSYLSASIILAPTFSLNLWVKVVTPGEFLFKTSTLNLTLDSPSTLTLYFSYISSQTINFEMTIGSWEYVSIVVSNKIVEIYLNEAFIRSSLIQDVFDDDSSDKFYFSQDSEFTGFLYSIHILNEASVYNFYFAQGCVSSSVCLSICEFGQDSSDDCKACPEFCTKGCYSGNCLLCSNDLCTKCSSIGSCSKCILNSTLTESTCSCDSGYFFNHNNFSCDLCGENCISCNSTECFLCETGFYLDNSSCIYCPLFCSSCNPTCTSCIENAILLNGTCFCPIGYNNETCEYSRFDAILSKYGSSKVLLYFQEPLKNDLKKSDFNVKIDDELKDFVLIKESLSKYLIELNLKAKSYDQTLILSFFSDVVAASNALLDKKSYSLIIFKTKTSSDYENNNSIKIAYSEAIYYGTIGLVAISTIGRNPASMWSFINTIQLLCFSILSGVNITSEIEGMLIGLRSYYLFPNTIEYLYQDDTKHIYEKAKKLGFKTNSFLINTGKPITAFCFFLVYYFIFFLLSKCNLHCKFLNDFTKSAVLEIKYGFFIRFSIQNYLEICVSCLISVFTHSFSDIKSIINLSVSIVFSILLIILPVICVVIAEKNRKVEHVVNKDEFKSLYGTLFYEFNSDENMSTSYYYTFFFTRRLLYSIVLFMFLDYPVLQMCLCIILSLANFFYLFECKPFSEPLLNYSNLLSESGICLFFCIFSILLFDIGDDGRKSVDTALKFILNAIMGIQMGASLAIFIKTIYQKVKQQKQISQIDIENTPYDSPKDCINPSFRSINEKSFNDVYVMAPKQEEYLKKKMCEESTILSPRIKY